MMPVLPTTRRQPVAVLACALLLSATALAVAAADVQGEIKMAATHADLAAKATTVQTVDTHLHHTINCLVGPKGTQFDAKAANPCAKLGDGAIADATDAAQKKSLQEAVDKAVTGLKETDLAAAQKSAGDVASMLKDIK